MKRRFQSTKKPKPEGYEDALETLEYLLRNVARRQLEKLCMAIDIGFLTERGAWTLVGMFLFHSIVFYFYFRGRRKRRNNTQFDSPEE